MSVTSIQGCLVPRCTRTDRDVQRELVIGNHSIRQPSETGSAMFCDSSILLRVSYSTNNESSGSVTELSERDVERKQQSATKSVCIEKPPIR